MTKFPRTSTRNAEFTSIIFIKCLSLEEQGHGSDVILLK